MTARHCSERRNLASGQATYTTAGLSSGAHNITATYGGDTNFNIATSGSSDITITVAPQEFALSLTQTAPQTVVAGSATTYTFGITPTYGAFPAAVTFSVSGLPAGATYTFNPTSIPANSTGGPVSLTVQTAPASATASLQHRSTQLAWALLLLPLIGIGRLRRTNKRFERMGLLMLFLSTSAAMIGLSGCGTSSGSSGQASKNYTLTVTATSGSLQHSINLTLNVQ
jgi:hypothetical protein